MNSLKLRLKWIIIIYYIFYFIKNNYYSKIIINTIFNYMGIGDWGLGIGDWGLGMGIGPNPQSPIPNK